MKKPFDLLLTDKEPFLVIEKGNLIKKDGLLVCKRSSGDEIIPVASLAALFLGNGTTISHDAARMCAENDCFVVIANAEFNAHSVWHAGRYSNPENLCKQAIIFNNKRLRLRAAKYMGCQKAIRCGREDIARQIRSASDVYEILGIEAALTKSLYRRLSGSRDFKREFVKEGINGRISLLNSMIYNFCTVVCLTYGISPSLGFLHGTRTRGGFIFDLADVFKYELSLIPAFSEEEDSRDAMRRLSGRLRADRCAIVKDMIKTIEGVLSIANSYCFKKTQ